MNKSLLFDSAGISPKSSSSLIPFIKILMRKVSDAIWLELHLVEKHFMLSRRRQILRFSQIKPLTQDVENCGISILRDSGYNSLIRLSLCRFAFIVTRINLLLKVTSRLNAIGNLAQVGRQLT